ncbi:hypothetical protein LPJ63_001722 [Coemansia sp. RSA 2711]|nr:hypothetical protein LPJ63_001722 [Coemansia sp. RSA 2711]
MRFRAATGRRTFSALRNGYSAAQQLAARADDAQVDCLVIGGGVVGLAAARQLAARADSSVLVVEKNDSVGAETSSRNSEVIHAGIFYPRDSLRTQLCIEGKRLLYAYCQERRIPHARVGKWVVARDAGQEQQLQRLAAHCADVGVPARMVGRAQAARDEPCVRAHAVLDSPTTGIVDSHALLAALRADLEASGGDVALRAEVLALSHDAAGFRALVSTGDRDAPLMAVRAGAVVNAAGLWADRVACMLDPDAWASEYRLHFAKGRYFAYTGPARVRRLVYPLPDRHVTSLGTHLTLDLAGTMRFGPDLEWVPTNTDYSVDSAPIARVAAAVAAYLPSVRPEHLAPGYAGIRPKLQSPGGRFRDFVVREESAAGFPRLVNLVGIESPGLTASLAIARLVDRLLH